MSDMRSLREKIDRLDKRIVKLINKRARYADEIGKLKEKLGIEVYSPEREKQVISNVSSQNRGPLTDEAVSRVYERIIDESRRLERESAEERRTSLIADSGRTLAAFFKNLKEKNRLYNGLVGHGPRPLTHLVLAMIVFFLLVWCALFFLPFHEGSGGGTVIAIERGTSADRVYSKLRESDAITNRFLFKLVSKICRVEHKIKAGKYLFAGHFSDYDVLKIIASGKSNLLVTVTIPEGLTVRQIAGILRRDLGVDSAEFAESALGDSVSKTLGVPSRNMEGYLFPETYDFYYDADRMEIMRRMYEEFEKYVNDSLKDRAAQLGLSMPDVIKMASIIESEARVDSERAVIASVYYNRLRKHVPLEADPTIQYAMGERERVYYKDLRINSPFNTYERLGLPPTPICNPGIRSIIAALYPAKTNYLYFVANGRNGHTFSDTYDRHLKAVRAFKRSRTRG
jgi:UPF0755 protein